MIHGQCSSVLLITTYVNLSKCNNQSFRVWHPIFIFILSIVGILFVIEYRWGFGLEILLFNGNLAWILDCRVLGEMVKGGGP